MKLLNIAVSVFTFLFRSAPLVEQMVRVAEATFNISGAGKDKLEYVLSELKFIYEAEQNVTGSLAWDALTPFLSRNVSAKANLLFPKQTGSTGGK